jgi:hypothetical protein
MTDNTIRAAEVAELKPCPMVRAIFDGLFHRVDAAFRVETSLFDRLLRRSRRRLWIFPVDGRSGQRVCPVPPSVILLGHVNAVVDFVVREIVAGHEGFSRSFRGILA